MFTKKPAVPPAAPVAVAPAKKKPAKAAKPAMKKGPAPQWAGIANKMLGSKPGC